MTEVTFGTVELVDVAPFDFSPYVICNVALLLSGKTSVRTSSKTGFKVQMACCTEDYSDVTDLMALVGQKKTLTIGGIPYTNCAIRSWDRLTEDPVGVWWYTVTFVRETI